MISVITNYFVRNSDFDFFKVIRLLDVYEFIVKNEKYEYTV